MFRLNVKEFFEEFDLILNLLVPGEQL